MSTNSVGLRALVIAKRMITATVQRMTVESVYLTVEEFANLMRVTPMTVRRLARAGQLNAIKVGRQYRIPRPSHPTPAGGDPAR